MNITGLDYWRDLAQLLERRTGNAELATVLGIIRPSVRIPSPSICNPVPVLANEHPYAPKLNEKVQLTHKEHPSDVKRRSAVKNQEINSENI